MVIELQETLVLEDESVRCNCRLAEEPKTGKRGHHVIPIESMSQISGRSVAGCLNHNRSGENMMLYTGTVSRVGSSSWPRSTTHRQAAPESGGGLGYQATAGAPSAATMLATDV